MKKLLIPFFSLLLCYACSDNKKNKATEEGKEQTSETGSTSEDKAIVEWLVGKEWKAEDQDAPISMLHFFSKDTVATINGKSKWSFEKGSFIMLADWPLAKLNDTTFTLYVKPTQKTFRYGLVKSH